MALAGVIAMRRVIGIWRVIGMRRVIAMRRGGLAMPGLVTRWAGRCHAARPATNASRTTSSSRRPRRSSLPRS